MYKSILELVGRTPLVQLNKINPFIHAKIESFNPTSSVKDRIALAMIEDAERRGAIRAGDTIVEPTSGNTGIGLAMVAAVKGYALVLTMPESMSIERRNMLKAFGAKLVLTPAGQGMKGAIAEAEELARKHGYFQPQQFNNPANPEVHRLTTGPEIIADLNRIDFFVAGVGTGGTITGAGRVLKEHHPQLRIVAVEPEDSPVLSGGQPGPHKIQGIGAGFVPDILDTGLIDDIIQVKAEAAYAASRMLATQEGILAGISSGANLHAAMLTARANPDQNVVVVICDTGERYLSTELFVTES